MFEMVPPDRINSVKTALQALLGNIAVQQTTLLTAGSQSTILKLIIDDQSYILRIMDLEDNLSNRKNQIQCLKTASVGRALRPTFPFISPQIQSNEVVLHQSTEEEESHCE